jgi:hypothetical protein
MVFFFFFAELAVTLCSERIEESSNYAVSFQFLGKQLANYFMRLDHTCFLFDLFVHCFQVLIYKGL